ncbi:MAG: hypothetical protein PHO08_12170 [Methylococcales bacterium]|nr:hypothetical protein [Methylococcales bacterium]
MKTRLTTRIIAMISVLIMGVLNAAAVKAETTESNNALIYNNRAYVQDIGYAPNPVPAWKVQDAEIIYVNTAYGPATYSYPSNVSYQHTAFNVEYIDTAYGPAIYSYPRNNMKHSLKLGYNTVYPDKSFIIPASYTMKTRFYSPR